MAGSWLAAGETVWLFFDPYPVEQVVQYVDQKQGTYQGFSYPQQAFDGFRGLQGTDHAGDGTQDAG